MEKRRLGLRKKFSQDLGLRILAVVLAVIIWFILSITLYPTIYLTVDDVPVELNMEGTTANAQGLAALDFDKETLADISISGMRYEIGNYKAEDLTATVDLSGVTEPGTYELDIKVTPKEGSCEVLKISPETVKVKFDYIKTVAVPLQVRATSISADEGYSLDTPVVSPETINVTGPEKLVQKISYAVFAIDQKKVLKEAYTTSDGKLLLYTEDGSLVDDSSFELDYEPISVNFPVYFLKDMTFSFDYQGVPGNFDTSILKYSLSTDSIEIMSKNSDILNQDTIHLGYISLNTINLEDTVTFAVSLDAGQTSTSGIDTVTITFDPTGFVAKEFTIPSSNIKVIGVPKDKMAVLSTKALTSVVIYGPQDVMETLSASDLIAEYDMQSSALDNGSYTRAVNIYAPHVDTVWCYGTKEIVFTIADKPQVPVSGGAESNLQNNR